MNFYWKVGLGFAVVLVVALLALFLLPRGESAVVERQLKEAVDAARAGDAEKVVGYISKQYGDGEFDYQEVCLSIRRFVGPGKYKDLEVSDVKVRVIGESASARFKVRVVQPAQMPLPYFDRWIDVELKKEEGRWMVTSARSNPAK